MSTDLREELDALARTQTFSPDPSLWDRGRRARRRGQVLAVAAVLVVLASLGGVVTLVSTDREARTAASEVVEGGAIPRRITDIPPDLDLTSDLAVGRASVAFISATDDPVVVTATDGVPHRLALPGWSPTWIALALSPDGRTLAYQHASEGGTEVSLLDLEDGSMTVVQARAGDRLVLNALSWSPGGESLAWVASRVTDTPSFAGQVRLSGGAPRRIVPSFNAVSVAVADDGDAVLGRVSGALEWWGADGVTEPIPTEAGLAPGAFSPDDTLVALASAPGTASYTLDTSTGEIRAHPFPADTFGDAVVRPLGWLDDRLQLLLVQELGGSGGELVVTTPAVGTTSTWRRSVGAVDSDVMSSVSLAVDLVPDLDGTSSQELTHDFGDVLARDQRDISWIIGLGVAAAIGVLLALRRLWRLAR